QSSGTQRQQTRAWNQRASGIGGLALAGVTGIDRTDTIGFVRLGDSFGRFAGAFEVEHGCGGHRGRKVGEGKARGNRISRAIDRWHRATNRVASVIESEHVSKLVRHGVLQVELAWLTIVTE